jgi:RimJ/RimL family protein N-acetyltransferase/GNAT superfamily N-acetyltransferase
MRPSDAAPLAARRNDPEVARYQDWTVPYPLERAQQTIAEVIALGGPSPDEWWMVTVADPTDTAVHGDLVVHLSSNGRTAEIGYTLARDAWGRGLAAETVSALVAYLFEQLDVTRVEGRLQPENLASAMVLERVGMRWEGHLRLSYWIGDDNSDDLIYGMTRTDWEQWRDRPRGRPESIELVEITHENLPDVLRLQVHRSQERLVADVRTSLAEALIPPVEHGVPVEPWYRAVAADGAIVGFVMVARSTRARTDPYLWRLLVDRGQQRRGIGASVVGLVVERARAWGATGLTVSWRPGKGSPEPMYRALGFVPTGAIEDGEIVARLPLEP